MKRKKMSRVICYIIICCLFHISSFGFSYENTESETHEYYDNQTGIEKSKVLDYVDEASFMNNNYIDRLEEIEELNTYAFKRSDGLIDIYILSDSVKYLSEDNTVREKDLSLVKANDGYIVKSNFYDLFFPDMLDSNEIVFGVGNNHIQMSPVIHESNLFSSVSDTTILYSNTFGESTSLLYTPTLNGLKEEIILYKKPLQSPVYSFSIITNGMSFFEDESGYYIADSICSNVKFRLGCVDIFDSNSRHTYGDIIIETIKESNYYQISLVPDSLFLTSPETNYPVIIDPSFTIDYTDSPYLQDAPVFSGFSSNNFGSFQYNSIGYCDLTYGTARTCVYLSGLENSSIFSNLSLNQVVSVKFAAKEATGTQSKYVNLYRCTTGTWTSSNVTWNSVFGTFDTSVNCGGYLTNGSWTEFDITSFAWAWKSGKVAPSYRMVFTMNSSQSSFKQFDSTNSLYSSSKPYIVVTYNMYEMEKGYYTIRNIFTDLFVNSTGNTAGLEINQVLFDGSLSQRWYITKQADDSYLIKNLMSNLYLGVETSNSSVSLTKQYSYSSNNELIQWYIIKSASSGWILIPKCNILTSFSLYAPNSAFSPGDSIKQKRYSNNSNYNDEWYLIKDYTNMFLGSPDNNIPMVSIIANVNYSFESNGYYGFSAMYMSKSEMISHMHTSRLFSAISHAEYYDVISLSNGETIEIGDINSLTNSSLNALDFVLLGSCRSGNGGLNSSNFVNSFYNKGAAHVVGFMGEIYSYEADFWIEDFIQLIANSCSINDAFIFVDYYIKHDDFFAYYGDSLTVLEWNRYVLGDTNYTPCP